MKRLALHAIALMALAAVLVMAKPSQANEPQRNEVKKWAVDKMVAWARPGISLLPAASESFDDGKERYGEIAESVLRTVSTNRPLFQGEMGRMRTAALLLSIAMFESSYRKDVDQNLGKEGRGDGGRSWCLMQVQLGSPVYIDSYGKQVPMVQVCSQEQVTWSKSPVSRCVYIPPAGAKASTPTRIVFSGDGYELTSDQTRGYSGQDLIADRDLCFSAGLRIIRSSFGACGNLPVLDRLSAYASGNCSNGREASRRRIGAAVNWISSNPPPIKDRQLVSLFFEKQPDPSLLSAAPSVQSAIAQ